MQSEGNASDKWRTNSWFLLHNNAPAHRSVLFKDFLAKSNVTTVTAKYECEAIPPHYSYGLGIFKDEYKKKKIRTVGKRIRLQRVSIKAVSHISIILNS